MPYRFISQTHNALDKRHTIHDFVTEMCTRVHISATKWRIVGHGTGAFWGIYATGLLWKLDLQISYDERPTMVTRAPFTNMILLKSQHG